MIAGMVTDNGVPVIMLLVADQMRPGIISVQAAHPSRSSERITKCSIPSRSSYLQNCRTERLAILQRSFGRSSKQMRSVVAVRLVYPGQLIRLSQRQRKNRKRQATPTTAGKKEKLSDPTALRSPCESRAVPVPVAS